MDNAVISVGLPTMGLGILVTFVALVFLIVIVYLLSAITRERKKPKKTTEEVIEQAIAEPEATQEVSQTDDGETIAVISAALAAYLAAQGGSMNGLVIKSYRRTDVASPWAKAGRNAQIYNKF